MKHILIIESEYAGHYLTGYIKYVLRSLKNKKFKIIILVSKETILKGKGAIKILKDENVNFKLVSFQYLKPTNKSKLSFFNYQLRLFLQIKKNFEKLHKIYNFDHVFCSSIQRFDKILPFLGSPFGNIKFSGVMLGLKFHLNYFNLTYKETNSLVSNFLFNKILKIKTLTSIITNDYLLKKYIDIKKTKFNSKLIFLHDPKEFRFKYSKKSARKLLNLDTSKKIILVYGAIINTKGIKKLLNIFKGNLKQNLKVIIAGKHYDEMKYYLKKDKFINHLIKQNNLSIYSGWQSEITESKLFYSSDVVWIGYENYPYPSGVLYQAIAARKPSIISNNGFIRNMNNRYKFGLNVNINDRADILDCLSKLEDTNLISKLKKNILLFDKISKPTNWVSKFKEEILYKI